MRFFFMFGLCLLTAPTSQAPLRGTSDRPPSSQVGDLKRDLLAMAQKGWSEINTLKDNYGSVAAEAMAQNGWSGINTLKDNYGSVAAEAMERSRQSVLAKMPEFLQSTADMAYEINYAELPMEIKTWIAEHPYQTTFHIVNGVVFFYPSLLTGPVFWGLGWTSTGPRAGSAAAALMAKLGVVPSKGAYAYLQSAAMGGYGSALAQGVTRAGSVAGEASSWLTSYWRGATSSRVDDNAEGERSQEAGVKADMPLKVKAKL